MKEHPYVRQIKELLEKEKDSVQLVLGLNRLTSLITPVYAVCNINYSEMCSLMKVYGKAMEVLCEMYQRNESPLVAKTLQNLNARFETLEHLAEGMPLKQIEGNYPLKRIKANILKASQKSVPV